MIALLDVVAPGPGGINFRFLADVDAILNGIAFVLICAGLVAIKRGNVELHKKLMLAAVGTSALFLACYLTYHATCESVKFQGEGAIRPVYFTLLISHIVLAAVQVPLILRTVYLGLKDRRQAHKKWAKITTPIWLYVSITGVVIYVMLYHT
jgi:putative membrane protein